MALGAAFIPWAGIQTDEALFAAPMYVHPDGGKWPAAMIMSYLGTFKSYLYLPVFAMFGTGVWATRLPMLLAGAATILIFYQLAKKSQGVVGASLAAVVLATDPIFLLTHTFDWGPVAMQILLTTAGCYALFRFAEMGRGGWLAFGFLCFGLALWNKALFSWILVGLAVGAVVFSREVLRLLSLRNLLISFTAFALGAAPLLVYNAQNDFPTLRENTHLVAEQLGEKWTLVPMTLGGSALFGYVVNEEDAASAKPAWAVSEWLRGTVGPVRSGIFAWVLAGMLVAIPLWWRSRAAWFAIIAFFAGWVMMALTEGAGGSAHHVILLWPLPLLFAAAVLGRMGKRVAIPVAVAVVAMNLAVLHQYHYQFQRFGAGQSFTDALLPLNETLGDYRDKTIYIADWGIIDSVVLAHKGTLNLRYASGELSAEMPDEGQRRALDFMLADPQAILVSHVRSREYYPVGEHLEREVERAGKRREILRTIADSNGRPMYEISRVVSRVVAEDVP